MAEYLKKINRSSVVQRVIDRLTEAIVSGELKPGDRIPTEMELAEQMGVARNSIREAVKILVYIGVLEIRRADGTFVCDGFSESLIDPMVYGIILNQQNEQELNELRTMIESGVMRLAIEKASDEELAELKEHLAGKCIRRSVYEGRAGADKRTGAPSQMLRPILCTEIADSGCERCNRRTERRMLSDPACTHAGIYAGISAVGGGYDIIRAWNGRCIF